MAYFDLITKAHSSYSSDYVKPWPQGFLRDETEPTVYEDQEQILGPALEEFPINVPELLNDAGTMQYLCVKNDHSSTCNIVVRTWGTVAWENYNYFLLQPDQCLVMVDHPNSQIDIMVYTHEYWLSGATADGPYTLGSSSGTALVRYLIVGVPDGSPVAPDWPPDPIPDNGDEPPKPDDEQGEGRE